MTYCPNHPLITILGPTASGKTSLAVNLAKDIPAEIISADSRQVYTQMDLGTGKDLNEYENTPYHLIDIINPKEEYNLFRFSEDFLDAFKNIERRNKTPFLVGGTGMYLDAILNRYKLTIANINQNTRDDLEKKTEIELKNILGGLKPQLHNTTDFENKKRLIRAIEIAISESEDSRTLEWPVFSHLTLGIKIPREELKRRIQNRLKLRFEAGMIAETQALIDSGVTLKRIDSFGLEYRFILKYILGQLNFNDMFQQLNSAIYKFSKQQEKWFKNIEKKGHSIIWLNADESLKPKAKDEILQFLDKRLMTKQILSR